MAKMSLNLLVAGFLRAVAAAALCVGQQSIRTIDSGEFPRCHVGLIWISRTVHPNTVVSLLRIADFLLFTGGFRSIFFSVSNISTLNRPDVLFQLRGSVSAPLLTLCDSHKSCN